MASDARVRPGPEAGLQPAPKLAALAWRKDRTSLGAAPFSINAAAAALGWGAAGEVPAKSHQANCVGASGANDCARTPSHSPSWLTSWSGWPPGPARSSASPELEYAVIA